MPRTQLQERFDRARKVAAASRRASVEGRSAPAPWRHTLPPLPYAYAALEPYIDARTMRLHHEMHHAGYVAKLNRVLEPYPKYRDRTAEWLLLNSSELPQEISNAVRDSAGGHVNHSLFWLSMSAGGSGSPAGPLAAAIDRDFGGLEQLKVRFAEVGEQVSGSGWVWLARTRENGGRLAIYASSGHDNPMLHGHVPVLVNDVWEHAYYLKYENRRRAYLQAWWSVVDWAAAARRFEQSDDSGEQDWEGEGGRVLSSAT